MQDLSHTEQIHGFPPVCIFIWNFRLFNRLNDLVHSEQLKGFSDFDLKLVKLILYHLCNVLIFLLFHYFISKLHSKKLTVNTFVLNLIRNALGVEKLTEGPESSSSSFQY